MGLLCCFIFSVGFFMLIFHSWHYLVVLLCVELMILSVFLLSFVVYSYSSLVLCFFLLLFLVLIGSFSLSVLVYCFGGFGEDYYKVFISF